MDGLAFGWWGPVLAVYAAGLAWGLLAIDAPPLPRVGLALAWPLGPLAFVVTVAVLLGASLVAFPLLGVAVLLAAASWVFFSP